MHTGGGATSLHPVALNFLVFLTLGLAFFVHLTVIFPKPKPSDFDAEPVFVFGKPYVEIVKAAADMDVDLIVLGSHGRSGISRLVLGSVAEKVVRLAPCPVFTVKPQHPAVRRAA
jgi:hypothetical protein